MLVLGLLAGVEFHDLQFSVIAKCLVVGYLFLFAIKDFVISGCFDMNEVVVGLGRSTNQFVEF